MLDKGLLNTTENRWEQELWVRVENTTVSTTPLCFDTKKVATLYINKLPELLRSFVPFNQCNLGIFNLTTKERSFPQTMLMKSLNIMILQEL